MAMISKNAEFLTRTFICGDCGRAENRPDDQLPQGWDLIDMDCSGTPFVRCPDCNEAIEQRKFAEHLAARAAQSQVVPKGTKITVKPSGPRPFTVCLERQDDSSYRIAMMPEAVLMRWYPMGFFLTAAEARQLATELRTFAALAEATGTIPARSGDQI